MEAIVPYLMFNGNCKEAMDFYAEALGGTIVMSQTYGDSNQAKSDADKDRIMHATLKAGELTLMFSDCPPDVTLGRGDMITLSLNFTDKAEMEKVYAKLSAGGTLTMPPQDTFWGAYFAMWDDKFGNSWMANHDYADKPHS